MKKGLLKKVLPLLTFTAIFALTLTVFAFDSPEAAAQGWSKAGITKDGNLKDSSVYTDLGNLVYFVMAIGGFWALICIVFAGMRLSAAQGNPQARTQGLIGLCMAGLGVFVVVQASQIAGWFAGFGG